MPVFHLHAILNSQPWHGKEESLDTQTCAVVVAANEAEARQLAAVGCGDEGCDAWIVPGCITVEELDPQGPSRMVATDLS